MSKIRLWTEAGIVLFAFLVMVPSIAAAIGHAAWNGKPRNYSREIFFTAFVLVGGVSGALLIYAIRMRADIRTWKYLLQVACFGIGTLLLGVAGGCMIGVFAYRRLRGTHTEAKITLTPDKSRNRKLASVTGKGVNQDLRRNPAFEHTANPHARYSASRCLRLNNIATTAKTSGHITLASGPTVPPVSHCGPFKVTLKRLCDGVNPLLGTP
jgi:hypothetical protein